MCYFLGLAKKTENLKTIDFFFQGVNFHNQYISVLFDPERKLGKEAIYPASVEGHLCNHRTAFGGILINNADKYSVFSTTST